MSQVRCKGKIEKMHRSAVMQKLLKLAVLFSRNDTNNAKSRRSAVKEKFQKVAGPRSQKNAKKSQVRGHRKMPITLISAGTEEYENCISQ